MGRGSGKPYAKRICGNLKKDLQKRRKFAAQTCFLHQIDTIERLYTAMGVVYPLAAKAHISARL